MDTLLLNQNDAVHTSWEKLPKERKFTEDDLIDKYLEGLHDGYHKARKTIEKEIKLLFKTNISKAQQIGESVFHKLLEAGIDVSIAYMKIEPVERFTILYHVNSEQFYSDKIIEGYKIFNSFQIDNMENDFYLDLSFLPAKGEVNNECLVADGFIFHYEQGSQAPKYSKA